YTIYRRELDSAPLLNARHSVEQRIQQLKSAGDTKSSLYQSLVNRDDELAAIQALQTSNAYVVQKAEGSAQVQPRPVRNGILGFVLGIVLGVALAFVAEALDTRVRSAEEIGEYLGRLPLLGRIPA